MGDYKPSIKILMTTDTVGGVWTYCMELCAALYDAEIHLVTMGAKMNASQKKEVAALQNVIVYETECLLEWMQEPWNDIEKCGEWLLHLEEETKPDIIHLNCFAYGALPFKAPVIVVAHSDVYSWFLSVKKQAPPVEWECYFECVKNGLNGADLVIAPSKAMLQFIQTIYAPETTCRVIYNGRSQKLFYQAQKQPVVFSMGRLWDEAKNIKLLTEAAPFMNATIKVAGENSFEQNHFTIQNNVLFLGKLSVKEIAEHLSSASVFVLPAKYEPFGLSPLEAALSGCALVLGDISSLKEIWQDAVIYVDTDDAQALANTINDLLNDKERLAEYQFKAYQRAKQFLTEAMAEEYLNVYQQLFQQKEIYLKQEII